MFSVIFEVHPKQEKFDFNLDLAKGLTAILEGIDGFIDNEHLESIRRLGSCVTDDRSRRRSYQPGHPLRRTAEQRCPKLGIRRHQSIKRETPIETTRIRKNPGHRACKSRVAADAFAEIP